MLRIRLIMVGLGFVGHVNQKKQPGIREMINHHANNYNAVRKIYKELQSKKREIDPDEQFFEDDPKAVDELEYGKTQKNITHVETRSVIDEF